MLKFIKAMFFPCKHPFMKSEKVATPIRYRTNVKSSSDDPMFANDEYDYVVHVRKCGVCNKHFIDEGHELVKS